MKPRPYRWDTGLRFRVAGLLTFLISLLVVLGFALTSTFGRLDAIQRDAEATREHVLLMEQASGTYNLMTSSLRGFIITGQEPLLQPYYSGQVKLELTLEKLTKATDVPLQADRVRKVAEAYRTWVVQVAEPEIAAKRAGLPDAGRFIANGTGPNYIDEIRSAVDQYITWETDRLREDLDSAAQASASFRRLTWISVGIAMVLAVVGFLIFASNVTKATDALSAAAEALGRGERGVTVQGDFGGELRQVADAFSAMSMTLAAQEEELQAQQEELIAQNEELVAQQEELQSRAEALEKQDERLSRLNQVGQALMGTIEIEKLGVMILDEYLHLFGGTAGALLLAEQQSDQFVVQTERWMSPAWRGQHVTPSGPLARCSETGEIVVSRYPSAMARITVWDVPVPVAQEIYIPLVHTKRVVAVVVVAMMEETAISEEAHALWGNIARLSAVGLSAAVNHLEVRRGLLALQDQAAQVEELNAQLEEERDRAAAQLDIYLSIVSTMRAGAWLTDTGGNLLVVNSTFQEFFGDVPEGAPLDTVLARIAHQVDVADPFPAMVRQLIQSREGIAEGRLQLDSGHVLQWSSAPVGRGYDLVGRLFTFQDVTQMAELDRLKSEFVNTVSHELRTPLTSMMGYLSLVRSEQVGKLEPEQKEFLDVVARNTDRLANLINDLLDLQRIESGRAPLQRKPIQVADVIRHVAATFKLPAEQKGLTFDLEIAPDLPLISADPERLTQIAANLVSNAVKYTKEGTVRVALTQHGSAIVLEVEDSGVGIPPAEQKRIFDKFYRVNNAYTREAGGTGLGLSIVKMMVEEHGGQVKLESEPGKGSTFIVSLPLVLDGPLAG